MVEVVKRIRSGVRELGLKIEGKVGVGEGWLGLGNEFLRLGWR